MTDLRQSRGFVRPFELVVGDVILDVADVVRRVATINELLIKWSETFELGNGERYVYQPDVTPLVMTKIQVSSGCASAKVGQDS